MDADRYDMDEGARDFERAGRTIARYGLVTILIWIGGMKFTAYEAEGIQLFIRNSPLFAWLNQLSGVETVSALIGTVEIGTGVLLMLRPISIRAGLIGGALASATFLGTLSFLVTTPGVVEPSVGFPGLSVVPGQFLIKDLVLLGVSIGCFGESAWAWRRQRRLRKG